MDSVLGIIGSNYSLSTPEKRTELSEYFINELKPKILAADPLNEVVIISTCNRVELYFYGIDILKLIQNLVNGTDCYYLRGIEVCSHLFKVGCGVDSMLLGETEILGQLKDSYQEALDKRESKKYLNRLFQESFKFAKLARTNTKIGSCRVTYPGIILNLINSIFDNHEYKILLIGYGKLGREIYNYLFDSGYKNITVSNRNSDKTSQLNQVLDFMMVQESLENFDIIISAIPFGSFSVNPSSEMKLICDLGNEQTFIDPNAEGIFYYDLVKLSTLVNRNIAVRKKAVEEVLKLSAEETSNFLRWFDKQKNIPEKLERASRLEELMYDQLTESNGKRIQRIIGKFKHLIYLE